MAGVKRRRREIHGDDEARFWSWVDQNGPIAKNRPDLGRCWVWTGNCTPKGYAQWSMSFVLPDGTRKSRGVYVYRWAYERWIGPIPAGREIDHFACENPSCVRPTHVRPVTRRENSLRTDSPMAWNLAKTHCPQNHPYDEENTYWAPRGSCAPSRQCRKCRYLSNIKQRRKRQAAA